MAQVREVLPRLTELEREELAAEAEAAREVRTSRPRAASCWPQAEC